MKKLQLRRSTVPGHKPTSLLLGEVVINTADRKIYAGTDSNSIIQLGNDPIITERLEAKAGATIDQGLSVGGNTSVTGTVTATGGLVSQTSVKAPTGEIDALTATSVSSGSVTATTLTATGKSTLADTKTGALESTSANITGAATVHSLMTPGSVSAGGNIVATGKVSGGSVETANVIATNDVSMATATATGKVRAGSVETGAISATDITARVVKSDSVETTAILASGNISSGSLVTSTLTTTGAATLKTVKTDSIETGSATITGAATVGTTLNVNGVTTLKGVNTGAINAIGDINTTGKIKSTTGEITSLVTGTVNVTGNITAGSLTAGSIALTDFTNFDQRYIKAGTSMATAERLATPRSIAGVPFDGSANITIPAANVGALPIAGGTMTGSIAFNTTQANYDTASLNTGTSGGKNYLRQFRGGASDTTWHETVQADSYRLSTGTTDSQTEFSLSTTRAQFRSEVVSTSANGFRVVQGNYGAFIRNDGNNTYLMLTDSGDAFGSQNSLRPLTISNSTGLVSIGNGLIVGGSASFAGLTSTNRITGAGFTSTAGVSVGGALTGVTTGDFSGIVAVGGAISVGGSKLLNLYSSNNSTSNATIRLWGNTDRPTVIEVNDDNGYHYYSQRLASGATEFNCFGTGSFTDIQIRSDIRLKTNLIKVESALDKVNQLTAYHYDKRNSLDSDNYDRKEVGIIAQDLEKVLPEAIAETDNGMKVISISAVNALLINALKEATKRIENLEAAMADK